MLESNFSNLSYLRMLAEQTRLALSNLPQELLSWHEAAILRFCSGSGGFRGRRGGADLYYTAFAVRALHALGTFHRAGKENPAPVESRPDSTHESSSSLSEVISQYIVCQNPKTIIDILNLLNIRLLLNCPVVKPMRALEFVEGFRTDDGGYGKTRNAVVGSLYHSFLAALCHDLLGMGVPERNRLIEFAINHKQSDGGFSESVSVHQSSTNAAAAGLSLLSVLGLMDEELADSGASYLLNMQHDSGGWLAGRNVPAPDLLSAYTASVSLFKIRRLQPRVLAKTLAFVRICQGQDGGFSAGPWDGTADVEYTYYGLGIIALGHLI